ncbi:MAG: class I SAM-dependent methyltransferase [Defluviitaleaceae bacterium]|nr:class I SAM-dependent methyltransferase [Defluviitaleaceae bacterium]
MFNQLKAIMHKPALYESGTVQLWTDEHISKGMLEAHLHPDWDAATKKHAIVQKNVEWISSVAPAKQYRDILDLGCGPGIYAEAFDKMGYQVSGIDFSKRSINYARNVAKEKNLPITYYQQDYLTLDFTAKYDLITLIFYDFGTFSANDRESLLNKIYAALRPGGLFIVEVFTPQHFADKQEYHKWEYEEVGGYFSAEPYLCLHSFYRYDEQNTFCDRYIVITEQNISHINVWEHAFTKAEFCRGLETAGFSVKAIYGNMMGDDYCDAGKEMCFVVQKGGAMKE